MFRSLDTSQDLPRYFTNILDMPPFHTPGSEKEASLPFPLPLLPSPIHKRLDAPVIRLSHQYLPNMHDGAIIQRSLPLRPVDLPAGPGWVLTTQCRTCFMTAAYAAIICPRLPGSEVLPGGEPCISLVCALRGTLCTQQR